MARQGQYGNEGCWLSLSVSLVESLGVSVCVCGFRLYHAIKLMGRGDARLGWRVAFWRQRGTQIRWVCGGEV